MRRTIGLGLIGALAMMQRDERTIVIDATPDEPPVDLTDGVPLPSRSRPAVIAAEPKELSESDTRALAAAQAKRDRRAAKLARIKEDRT